MADKKKKSRRSDQWWAERRREMAFEDTFSEPDGAVPSVCDMR